MSARLDLDIMGGAASPAMRLTGAGVSGAAKLRQRALLLLLKDKATASEPDVDGTDVLALRRGNYVAASLDNEMAMASAVVSSRLRSLASDSDPADERLYSMTVDSEAASATAAAITLKVVSEDRASSTVTI